MPKDGSSTVCTMDSERLRLDVAEPLVHRQLFFSADAKRLVVLSARLQDVGETGRLRTRGRARSRSHSVYAPGLDCL
jgi:hypothetical protein